MARSIEDINSLINNKLSIREFYNKRNRILIIRDTGGLGDILMCRMIFEDFKILMPDCHLTFACPTAYHAAVQGHPFVDAIVDSQTVNFNEFIISYNITSACGKYENQKAPLADKHRSDIWAEHCGLQLTKHNMHLSAVGGKFKKPTVLIAPISAIANKNLDTQQMNQTVEYVQSLGFDVYGIHKKKIDELCCATIVPENMVEFFSFIQSANYIITVDTAAFHAAGGLNKPMVAVFSWACGKTYGKYYPQMMLVQKHRDDTPGWTCGPCYRWSLCPRTNEYRKPCITEITANDIILSFQKLLEKHGSSSS